MDVLKIASLRTMALLLAIRKMGGSATCPEIIAIVRRCKADSILGLTGAPDGKYGSMHHRLRKCLGNGVLTRTVNHDQSRGRPGLSHVYHLTEASLDLIEQWLEMERELGVRREDHDQEMPERGSLVCSDPQASAHRAASEPPSLGGDELEALSDDRREGDTEGADAGGAWGVYQPDPE